MVDLMLEFGSCLRYKAVATSSSTMRNGSRTRKACDRDMYSYSMVDRAVSVCNLLAHETGTDDPNVMTKPERDFTDLGSSGSEEENRPAKSASA